MSEVPKAKAAQGWRKSVSRIEAVMAGWPYAFAYGMLIGGACGAVAMLVALSVLGALRSVV
ncbi:hypothetical protein [Burkholderia multivorans]|uniref:hypothetical protein n=1 Tax=Burkholderia multivorans TaxID=87883 RepID=UPI001C21250B|nr:hypothetical protein [Burkholderia multivorans]ULR75109.1 hypothetical protein JC1_37 [Burkholderia phage JC1]MBU9386623.1 hypothetical protein [Burkholderia multivorans]MBU9437057.1 hypothetical protein [Burkholderia multivorans]MBU9606262.1 hypothetical protein [Burkholderia multivorans]MBU9624821.1 hypothetical protein [Burkholderia multivorans]